MREKRIGRGVAGLAQPVPDSMPWRPRARPRPCMYTPPRAAGATVSSRPIADKSENRVKNIAVSAIPKSGEGEGSPPRETGRRRPRRSVGRLLARPPPAWRPRSRTRGRGRVGLAARRDLPRCDAGLLGGVPGRDGWRAPPLRQRQSTASSVCSGNRFAQAARMRPGSSVVRRSRWTRWPVVAWARDNGR